MTQAQQPADPSKKQASRRITRRGFTRAAAAGTFAAQFGATFIPASAFGKMEKPALVGIGAGGKGRADISGSAKAGFQIVGLVDVVDGPRLRNFDNKKLKSIAEVRKQYSDLPFYRDYREMFADMGDKVDAVTVSTPDHHHFHASVAAMKAGKHVYCQKPLTHSIWEARMLAGLAARTGVKTQMGNQAHANDHMRDCVEAIQAGIIGKVTAIHAWTNRPIWPQGFTSAPPAANIPDAIDWEQWIGPAPHVDYSPYIAPFAWRGWWDYGTGALGDMACHIMDMGYWAMGLPAPTSVTASQHGATSLSPPINSKITWSFAPNEYSGDNGFHYHWYDGYLDAHFDRETWTLIKNAKEYNHPSEDILEGQSFSDFGSVVVGEKGKLFFNRSKTWITSPASLKQHFKAPEKQIHRAGGDNYAEWMDAITGRIEQSQSHFGNAGPLTETVLLGVVAQRVPDTLLEWNSEEMEIAGRPDLQKLIRRDYAQGWQVSPEAG